MPAAALLGLAALAASAVGACCRAITYDLIDPANTGLGHRQVQRWNLPDGWVISSSPAHQALVSEAAFVAVQRIRASGRATLPGRRYLLAGLLRCGVCARRLESCWANTRPAYRCRHGHTSATRPHPDRPKNLYVREDNLVAHLPTLYVLLTGTETTDVPPGAGDVIDHLRAREITLIYDPADRTLRPDIPEAVKITIDKTR